MIHDAQLKPVHHIATDLRAGDTIRHKESGNGYIVTRVFDTFAIAVDTIRVSVPDDWLVLRRHRVHTRRPRTA